MAMIRYDHILGAPQYFRHMVMSYAPNKTTNLRLGGCTPVGVRGRAACAAWHFGRFP